MTDQSSTFEWYYVGHYGQLGPLALDQVFELIGDGVIESDTYVWRTGQQDWLPAKDVAELQSKFSRATSGPPPAPVPGIRPTAPQISPNASQVLAAAPYGTGYMVHELRLPQSDKNKMTAAALNIIPGFGRFYLGYAAHGILQFMTAMCGVGILWSWADSLFILSGGVKYDGYGRQLPD